MKIKILIPFLVLTLKMSFGQYLVLPDSNVYWTIATDNGFGENTYSYYFTEPLNHDTVINTKNYTKLYWNPTSSYLGAFHSDTNGKTFFVPEDSTNEFLLYDLSKNQGDTIHNLIRLNNANQYDLFNGVVDSVQYIEVGQKTLKMIYLDGDAQNHWIEGIGSTRGFFNRDNAWLGASKLQCMSHRDTVYYPGWDLGSCSLETGDGIEEYADTSLFNIYPNPSNGHFTITLANNTTNEEFQVCNILGNLVASFKSTSPVFELNLSHQSKGFYFVKIISAKNSEVMEVKKVVIQ